MTPTRNSWALVASLTALLIGCALPGCDVGGSDGAAGEEQQETPARAARTADDAGGRPGPSSAKPKTDLFLRTFGDRSRPHVIFVHGGPGASGIGFEVSGAQALADRGFFVVTYDQRGGGRSPNGTQAQYSYAGASQDLDDLIGSLDLKAPVLIANSFGGSVALNYADRHPTVVRGIILVDCGINFPQLYFTILEHAADVYRGRLRFGKATEVDNLRAKMFPHGLVPPFTYTGEDMEAMGSEMSSTRLFYPDSAPTLESVAAYARIAAALASSDVGADKLMNPSREVSIGYTVNDKAEYSDWTPLLAKHKAILWAVYGAEDKIFDAKQLATISSTISPARLSMISGAGHFPFLDRPTEFVDAVERHLRSM